MDNLCHTLVGAALGEAGLKRRTAHGTAALMIAANLPDLDVLVFATGIPSLEFRRGWTHGIAAQLVLPLALTGVMVLARGRHRARPGEPPINAGWLLALAFIGVSSHVFLDALNNYGIRLLAPLDWRWLYGDAVFIVDPWLWLVLAAGVVVARRRVSSAPARVALALAGCYVGAMIVSAQLARGIVTEAWRARRGTEPRALMVGPVPVTPFNRAIIVDAGDSYATGTFTWPRHVTFDPDEIPKNDRRPEVEAARRARAVRGFLVWSRFPFWTFAEDAAGTRATVGDMRFMAAGARFTATATIPRAE